MWCYATHSSLLQDMMWGYAAHGVGWGGVGCDSIRHYCKTWCDATLRIRHYCKTWCDATLRIRHYCKTWCDASLRIRHYCKTWCDATLRIRHYCKTWCEATLRMGCHLQSRELGWKAPVAWMLWSRVPPLVSVPCWFQTGPRPMFRWPRKRKSTCCNVTIPREFSQNGSKSTSATGHTLAASMATGNWWKSQFQTAFVPKSKANAMVCCSNTFEVTNGDGNTLASTCWPPLAKL